MLKINSDKNPEIESGLHYKIDYLNQKLCKDIYELFFSDLFIKGFKIVLSRLKNKPFEDYYYISIIYKMQTMAEIEQVEINNIKSLMNTDDFKLYSKKIFNSMFEKLVKAHFDVLDLFPCRSIIGRNKLNPEKEKFLELFKQITDSQDLNHLFNSFYKCLLNNNSNVENYKNILKEKFYGEGIKDFEYLQELVYQSNGKITWDLLLKYSKVVGGKLEGIYWEEELNLGGTSIKYLSKFKKIYSLNLQNSVLLDLGDLEEVFELNISGSYISSLNNLSKANTIIAKDSLLKDLGNITTISLLEISGTKITTLGKLIQGNIIVANNSDLENLGELSKVKFLDITGTKVKSLVPLEVAEQIKADYSLLEDLGILREIHSLEISYTNINDLGLLKEADYIDAKNSKIKSLGELRKARVLNISNTEIKSLGDLEMCLNLFASNTKITNLGKFVIGSIYTNKKVFSLVLLRYLLRRDGIKIKNIG